MKVLVSQLTCGAAILGAMLLGPSMLSAAPPKKPATIKDIDNQQVTKM